MEYYLKRFLYPGQLKTEPPFNRPFWSFPGPLYQNEIKCPAFDMEMIFHSQASKTHFHKKGCALGLILKVRVFKNSEMTYSFLSRLQDNDSALFLGYLRPCAIGSNPRLPDPQTSAPPTVPHLPQLIL